jgi:CDP-glucose 4,6-dehydratase
MQSSDQVFWNGRRTFVTGGTGLLGSWLVQRLLDAGAYVVCLVRDWVPESELVRTRAIQRAHVVRGDVRDRNCIERVLGEFEIVTVFHLAAQAIVGIANRNPISTFETNIAGTWGVLEACRRSPTVEQVVIASSDKAYGDHGERPCDEQAALRGRHPYDASKACVDLLSQSYATTYGLPVAITRCGNLFGGGDLNFNRIVPGTIRAVLQDERPLIRSDGTYVRDYLYVEDGVEAYMRLAECLAAEPELAGQVFNFSNNSHISVLALVQRILHLMASDLQPRILNEVSHEILHQCLSTDKSRETLGWLPRFSLDTGLTRTIAWYRELVPSTSGQARRFGTVPADSTFAKLAMQRVGTEQ